MHAPKTETFTSKTIINMSIEQEQREDGREEDREEGEEEDEEFLEEGEGEAVSDDDDAAEPMSDDDDAAEPMSDDDDNDDDYDLDAEGTLGGQEDPDGMDVDGARGSSANSMEEDFEDDSVQGFFAHKAPVYSIALHPTDRSLVASGGGDDKMYLWRSDTGETIRELTGHTDSVTCVGFSATGQYVASGGMDGKVRVYDSENGSFLIEMEGPDELVWIDWHPKGNVLLGGATDGTLWMWKVPSGECMNVFAGHAGASTAGRFTPDGKRIVSVAEDASLIVWDPKTASAVHRLSSEDGRFHEEAVTTVAVDKDSSIALTGSQDGSARLINLHAGTILTALDNHSDSVEATGFCDILPLAATAGVDGRVSIWDVQTFHLRTVLVGHTDAVTQLVWHKNSALLSTCSADKTVRTWDARTGQCLKKQSGHQDAVLSLAVTDDGSRLVSGGDDGVALVYET